MKIEKVAASRVSAEMAEQYPYRADWRHQTPAELAPAEKLLAHLEMIQGVLLDEEASRAIQLAYDMLHQPLDVDEGPDDDPDPGERAAA